MNGNRPLRLALVGASGRMGRAIVRCAVEDPSMRIVLAVAAHELGRDIGELAGIGALGVPVQADLPTEVPGGLDVLIDFSSSTLVEALGPWARRQNVALVSGTTGLSPEAASALDSASTAVPVLWEPNMSLGVHVLAQLARWAVRLLGPGFDVEIVEAHHRKKPDAPSGTALRLYDVVAQERKAFEETVGPVERVTGRQGKPGPRPLGEVGVLALRGGDVVGDHTLHFLGDGERLELTHRATNRDLFARGALRAARLLSGRNPGKYTLSELIPVELG